MTDSVDPSRHKSKLVQNIGQEFRQLNRQIIVVVNTLLTVVSAFVFGYYGTQLAYPDAGLGIPTRTLIGLILATIVFFADLYFIIKNMD